jgi:hypothetical protein
MRRSFLLFAALLLSGRALWGQPDAQAGPLSPAAFQELKMKEDTLAFLAFAVVNDSFEQERFAACRALITGLVRALKVENSFKYPFERLRSVSMLVPPDSSFRMFTWQLFVNDSSYRYYGAIQRNRAALQLFPLIDRSEEMGALSPQAVMEPERWYGAMYYNLRQFDTKEGRKYLLMGYEAVDFFQRRKVVDVLQFDKNGKPSFGADVFDMPEPENPAAKRKPKPLRLMVEYVADAAARVNWDEQYEMVIMDHLVPIPSPHGNGVAMVPDGSYDALQWHKGRWKYISKVFNDVMEEAPRPEPILDARKNTDIMGKPKTPVKKD